MTWEILAALITICGFLITLCTLVYKFSKALTALETAVTVLKEDKTDNKDEHKKMRGKLEDHETRIGKLEIKVDVNNT